MPTVVQPYALAPPVAQKPGNKVLGKDEFLKMLVQQLRYQDPMNPLNGTEFAAQLAQFSSVEQLSNIQGSLLESIDANFVLSQSINNALAATFIGKDVRASTDTFGFKGSGEVKLGYSLPSTADNVKVEIRNSKGELVRTITGTGTAQGDNSLTWDGRGESVNGEPGAILEAGKYTFSVVAKDGSNASITANRFIYGTVTAVRYKADGTVFVLNGQEVSLSNILEILQG